MARYAQYIQGATAQTRRAIAAFAQHPEQQLPAQGPSATEQLQTLLAEDPTLSVSALCARVGCGRTLAHNARRAYFHAHPEQMPTRGPSAIEQLSALLEMRFVYGKLLAEVYFRIDGAMQGFFKRAAEGKEKPGFPRFKPRHQFFTLLYPAIYLEQVGDTIILPTGGGGNWGPKRYPNIVAHLTEKPPERFGEVAVSRDARGNYYCSFVYEEAQQQGPQDGIVAFDLGIKTLATGYSDQERFYHIGGFKGYRWYNKQLDKIRSKRDRCKKGSRRYKYLSNVYKRVSERKRRKQLDCLHKASHVIADRLAERAVVIGDLSQRQMVLKKHEDETPKETQKRHIRNRLVYNDWGLYSFVRMLIYKCLLAGKELHMIDERNTSKQCHACHHLQAMPLWKRTYHCSQCGLVMDRDENSAINIYQRFVARLGPHTDDSVRCAE